MVRRVLWHRYPPLSLYYCRQVQKAGTLHLSLIHILLERGITVPNADVLVLYADYERIFDTATLTQMAGRAGRAKDDTQAEVYFVARHVTASMHTAVRLIQDMNRHAARSGYLEDVYKRQVQEFPIYPISKNRGQTI